MDGANIRNMHRMLKGDPEGKIQKLLSFAGSERDISDPWYTGDFEAVYRDVAEGCGAFLAYLSEEWGSDGELKKVLKRNPRSLQEPRIVPIGLSEKGYSAAPGGSAE